MSEKENPKDNDNDNVVDVSFFMTDKAVVKSTSYQPTEVDAKKQSKPREKKEQQIHIDNKSPTVDSVDYAKTYAETNALILHTIAQVDTLASEIKQDMDNIRDSKTLKNKYTYLTNMTSSAGSLLSTKIAAIKELNTSITQSHNLELNRLKALKLDKANENDDKRIMDMYSAFINTPVGMYNPSAAPSIQDITTGVNGSSPVTPIDMVPIGGYGLDNGALTPEQNRIRMEKNTNIQTVVRYNQATGYRAFDVVDVNTGASVPNYPRPDAFLLEDTTINIHDGIARNRNINTVWPLIIENGSDSITEY